MSFVYPNEWAGKKISQVLYLEDVLVLRFKDGDYGCLDYSKAEPDVVQPRRLNFHNHEDLALLEECGVISRSEAKHLRLEGAEKPGVAKHPDSPKTKPKKRKTRSKA